MWLGDNNCTGKPTSPSSKELKVPVFKFTAPVNKGWANYWCIIMCKVSYPERERISQTDY